MSTVFLRVPFQFYQRSQLDSGPREALRIPTGSSSAGVGGDVYQISVSKSKMKRGGAATAGFCLKGVRLLAEGKHSERRGLIMTPVGHLSE